MIIPISTFNTLLAGMTIAGQLFILVLLLSLLYQKNLKYLAWIQAHAILLVFLASAAAVALSLFYSEIIGFDPCKLCWIQRIFMYPLVILFGVALWKKDGSIVDSALALSLLGGLVALYHSYGQVLNASVLPCPVGGATPSCAQRFFIEFGYITIPVMSLTAFAFIFVVLLTLKWEQPSDGKR